MPDRECEPCRRRRTPSRRAAMQYTFGRHKTGVNDAARRDLSSRFSVDCRQFLSRRADHARDHHRRCRSHHDARRRRRRSEAHRRSDRGPRREHLDVDRIAVFLAWRLQRPAHVVDRRYRAARAAQPLRRVRGPGDSQSRSDQVRQHELARQAHRHGPRDITSSIDSRSRWGTSSPPRTTSRKSASR